VVGLEEVVDVVEGVVGVVEGVVGVEEVGDVVVGVEVEGGLELFQAVTVFLTFLFNGIIISYFFFEEN